MTGQPLRSRSRSSCRWSQDKDLSDAGLAVFTTGDLLDGLRADGHID